MCCRPDNQATSCRHSHELEAEIQARLDEFWESSDMSHLLSPTERRIYHPRVVRSSSATNSSSLMDDSVFSPNLPPHLIQACVSRRRMYVRALFAGTRART